MAEKESKWYESLLRELERLSEPGAHVERLTERIYEIVQEVQSESPVSQFVATDTIVMAYFRSSNKENFEPLLELLEADSLLRREEMSPIQMCVRVDGCWRENGRLVGWWRCCDGTGLCVYHKWPC